MMSNKEWNKLSDNWFKSSFDLTSNEIQRQKPNPKSRKRQMNEEIDGKSVDNRFTSDSIGLLDSMVAEDTNQLALSRYKCNELRQWFVQQFIDSTFGSKFLLLNGPTGAGKTTSLKVMSKEFNVEVIEYKSYSQYFEVVLDDKLDQRYDNQLIPMNQIENFKKFMADCVRYKTRLDLTNGVIETTLPQTETKRLVLIEEFPNVFYLKPEALHKELKTLTQRFGHRLPPIVFIISETINGHSEEYKLLPKPLQKELNIKTISFSSITDTSMTKILQRFSNNQLSKDQMKTLIVSSSGDVRSAINNLQLLYMHSMDTKSDKNVKKLRKISIDSNCDYVLRDSSLTLSHAIGKVLYAKRIEPQLNATNGESELEVLEGRLPDHLRAKQRIPLIDCPESIVDKKVVSSDVFNSWLHQNYIDFCDSIETAKNCMDWLCESDALFSSQQHFYNECKFDTYQCCLAMRGLMFNLSIGTESEAKPKRKFKPFERPQTFGNRFVDSLKRQIKDTIIQKRLLLSADSLVVDLMPFVSQMPKHLHSIDSNMRYILDKVIKYEDSCHQMREQELCYAFNHSSVNETINQIKCEDKVIEMDTDLDNEDDYRVEDIDSD